MNEIQETNKIKTAIESLKFDDTYVRDHFKYEVALETDEFIEAWVDPDCNESLQRQGYSLSKHYGNWCVFHRVAELKPGAYRAALSEQTRSHYRKYAQRVKDRLIAQSQRERGWDDYDLEYFAAKVKGATSFNKLRNLSDVLSRSYEYLVDTCVSEK